MFIKTNIAEEVGITTSHYGMIELGVRNPSLTIAHKLAAFFKTTIDDIFFGKQYNKTLVNTFII